MSGALATSCFYLHWQMILARSWSLCGCVFPRDCDLVFSFFLLVLMLGVYYGCNWHGDRYRRSDTYAAVCLPYRGDRFVDGKKKPIGEGVTAARCHLGVRSHGSSQGAGTGKPRPTRTRLPCARFVRRSVRPHAPNASSGSPCARLSYKKHPRNTAPVGRVFLPAPTVYLFFSPFLIHSLSELELVQGVKLSSPARSLCRAPGRAQVPQAPSCTWSMDFAPPPPQSQRCGEST
jgi:hypothetical protein